MIDHIGRAALAAALVVCIAGCGGGGGPSTSVPAVAPGGPSTSAAAVYPLSSAGSTFALPAAGGYGGTVSFPAFAAPPGATIAVTASTDPPAALSTAALRRPAVTGTGTVYFYLTLRPSVTISLPTVPAYAIDLSPSLAQQNAAFYYAISAPAASGAIASFRTEGPATVTGTKATFTPSAVPLTLRAGTPYVFGFYSLARVSAAPFVAVANTGNNTVAAYSLGTSGDVGPDFALAGPATQLASPTSLARDAAGRLYVGNVAGSIAVYASGATGNAAPVRTISGSLTGLAGLESIAVGPTGRIYAAAEGVRRGDSSVRVFAPGAQGNVAPVQTITSVSLATGIAVDAQGEIVVADADIYGPAIKVFAPSADGAAAPLRAVSGAATGLSFPRQLALDDTAGQVFVADAGAVSVFPLAANGNVAPVAQLAGPNTGLVNPSGVALTADTVVVADQSTWSVLEYARGALGNSAPVRVITGPYTTLDSPAAILVAP